MKNKSAGVIVSGVLSFIAALIWIIISILQAITLEGSDKYLGLWNFTIAILSIVIGIGLVQHKQWSRGWGIWTAIINIATIAYSWYSSSSMFFLFFLAIYAVTLILILANYSSFEENEEITTNSNVINKETTTKNKTDDFSLLKESKEKGLLTETEYEQKLIEIEVKKQTQQKIDTLTELKNNKLFTEEEFIKKKNQILSEKRYEIEQQYKNKAKLSDIPKEIMEKLSNANKDRLDRFIGVIAQNEMIVYHDNTIVLISNKRWNEIIETGTTDQYEIIIKMKE